MERKVIVLGLTLVIVVGLFGYEAATAEVIYLKDGSTIKGEVVSSTTDSLDVRTSYGMLRIGKDNVLRIEFDQEIPQEETMQGSAVVRVHPDVFSPLYDLVGKKVTIQPKYGAQFSAVLKAVSDREITYKLRWGPEKSLPLEQIAYIETGEGQKLSMEEIHKVIKKGRKRYSVGYLSAWFLPSLGHAYAGDWGRGAKFLIGSVGGYILVIVGTSMTELVWKGGYDWGWYQEEITDDGAALAGLGVLTILIFRIWEGFDLYYTIRDHNRQVEAALDKVSLELKLKEGVPMTRLVYRF